MTATILMLPDRERDSKVITLYVMLARDWSVFLEGIYMVDQMTLLLLLKALETENPTHDTDTKELNALGAQSVRNALERFA